MIFQPSHGGRPNAGVHPFHFETKTGVPLYHGDALGFEEWKFRVTTKLLSIVPKGEEEEDLADVSRRKKELAAKVLEGLRDEALKVAMDLGTDQIADDAGVEKLIAAMDAVVAPLRKREAKFLFREGTKKNGILSRQTGETMMSYTTRRKRWWKKLKNLDSTVQVSDGILAEYLLDSAGLDKIQKMMISRARRTRWSTT